MVQIDGVPADEEMQPALGEAPASEAPADDSFLNSHEAGAASPAAEAAAPATDDINFDAVSEKTDPDASGEIEFDFDDEPSSSEEPSSKDRPA
jgi:hypothetical protein